MVLRQYMFYSLPPRHSLVIPALVYTFALVSRHRTILASVFASRLARFSLPCGGRIPLMEYNLLLKRIEINLHIPCRFGGPV